MRSTIVSPPPPLDRLDVARFVAAEPYTAGDSDRWVTGGPLTVRFHVAGGPIAAVTIPSGTVADASTIPAAARALTLWWPWDDPQKWAVVTHGYLYTCNGREGRPLVAKEFADRALRSMLRAGGVNRARYTFLYWVVRLCSRGVWVRFQRHR